MNKKTNRNNKRESNKWDTSAVFKCSLIHWLWKVCQWLNKFYLSQPGLLTSILPLLHTLDLVLSTRGKTGFVTYVKDLRRATYGFLSGNQSSKGGVKCTSDGIPVVLGDLIPRLRRAEGATETCRLLTTILVISRCLNVGTSPDISSIVSPCKRERPTVGGNPRKFWKELGYSSRKSQIPGGVSWKDCHLTTKAGPNGHALLNSLIDLQTIDSELWKDLEVLGGNTFKIKCQILRLGVEMNTLPKTGHPVDISSVKSPCLRKLAWFPDKEDKVRVIGILDYWSQSVLRNLHFYLFRVLRKIPQDMTFDQGGFKAKTEGWSRFHSLDLTAATDRFPISIICDVLEGHFPRHYVRSWSNVMAGRPFRWTTKQGTEEVTYAVGNPMGAYSSWASFALSHHYVVFRCCEKLGIKWATAKYCLLGDDILIGDDALAEMYISTMEEIGVEISIPKTHQSNHFAEFAKRLLYKGEEISPFPLSALRTSSRRSYQLVNLCMELEKKGWMTADVPLVVSEFYGIVNNLPSRRRKKIRHNSVGCQGILRCMQNPSLASSVLPDLARHWGCSPDFEFIDWEEILGEALWLSFTKSLEKSYLTVEVVPEMVRSILDELKPSGDTPDADYVKGALVYCIPLLRIYNQFGDTYISVTDDAMNKRWRKLLSSGVNSLVKISSLPSFDQVFSMRRRDQRIFASNIIGKGIVKILKTLDVNSGNWVSARRP